MKEVFVTRVETFAKANKVSRSKLMDFVSEILANTKPVYVPRTAQKDKRAERKAAIMTHVATLGGVFTLKDLKAAGLPEVQYMVKLLEQENRVKRVDATPLEKSGRGRPAVMYQVV